MLGPPQNKVQRDREKLEAKRKRLELAEKAKKDKGKNQGDKRPRVEPTEVAVKTAPPTAAKKRYKSRLPRSLKEIRKFQRTGSHLIRRMPFIRVVKEITQQVLDKVHGSLAPTDWR